jgi:hypothetical protein
LQIVDRRIGDCRLPLIADCRSRNCRFTAVEAQDAGAVRPIEGRRRPSAARAPVATSANSRASRIESSHGSLYFSLELLIRQITGAAEPAAQAVSEDS